MSEPVNIYLIDGTYELFRSHFGAPPRQSPAGQEIGATLGMLRSLHMLLEQPEVTHVGVAFDHVITSFRNELYPGYKTGEGVDPLLLAQFPLAEQAAAALGVTVWSMVEFEADDALATIAARFHSDPAVKNIILCSPDKDLTQLVSGTRVVCWDRRRDITLDEAGVQAKFGVLPASIPDYLALVGDSADGFPGIPGWGAKSAAAVLSRYNHLETIPDSPLDWDSIPGLGTARTARLAESLAARRDEAMLYLRLATLRTDVPLNESLADLEWRGACPEFINTCQALGYPQLIERISRWRE